MNIKQLFMTSFAAMALTPAMAAVDIAPGANTADCDSDVLKTTSGSANLEANWDPNTISLNWYAGADSNTPLTVQTGAQTCTYDGAITLPSTQPTKPGYTFARWQVRAPQCFAGVDVSVNGSKNYSYDYDDICRTYDVGGNTVSPCSSSEFTGMSAGQWAVEFSYGVVRGIASCNNERNDFSEDNSAVVAILAELGPKAESGEITEEQAMATFFSPDGIFTRPTDAFTVGVTGRYCWCRITDFTPTNSGTCSTPTSRWAAAATNSSGGNAESPEQCAELCASECARVMERYDITRALFGMGRL